MGIKQCSYVFFECAKLIGQKNVFAFRGQYKYTLAVNALKTSGSEEESCL